MAIARAPDTVRRRIHQGDLLSLDLPTTHDMVFGLDVFEHLNPNKIDSYVERLTQITADDAYLFCNIPAFGADEVFGTLFPFYVDGWETDAYAGRPFSRLHVDDLGYPLHGHLTWADARWWVQRFERGGFRREIAVERALHEKYDALMEPQSPARRAFFVFSKGSSPRRSAPIAERISKQPSRVLSGAG